MQIYFFIALAITVLSIFIYLNTKNSLKIKMLTVIIGGIFSLTFLVFPLLEENNLLIKWINSFFYSLQCVGLNQDFSIISNIDVNEVFGIIYVIYVYIIFLALPLLTASIILIFLSDIFVKLKFNLNKHNDLYIFSDVNEKSITVAKKIISENKNKVTLVFTNYNRDNNIGDTIDKKVIKMSQSITNLKLGNKNNSVTFYLISKEDNTNLNDSLVLIEKYKQRENTKMYVVNNTEEASVILDSTDKGKVSVEIVNELERVIYNLLDTYPLYLKAKNNNISILIVGCGKTGKEFFKSVLWCGQVMGYTLKITIVDKLANEIKENIEIQMPDVLKNYDVNFVNEDINSKEAVEQIKQVTDINYVFIAMESDSKNINTAIMLRRLFLKQDRQEYKRKPVINIWIENEEKKEQVKKLVNERVTSYEFNAFGSVKDMYYDNCIIDSDLEELSKQVHLSYDESDINFEKYNRLEYNKRSSRATALHLKYKLYSVLRDEYTNNLEKDLQNYQKYMTNDVEEVLSLNEHDRWNAYMRSIGFTLATILDVKKYINTTKDYRHFLAKLHPALVEYDRLDKISEQLNNILTDKIDLKDSDKKIVKNMPNILQKMCKK